MTPPDTPLSEFRSRDLGPNPRLLSGLHRISSDYRDFQELARSNSMSIRGLRKEKPLSEAGIELGSALSTEVRRLSHVGENGDPEWVPTRNHFPSKELRN